MPEDKALFAFRNSCDRTLKSLWQDLVAAMKWAELDEARLQKMKTEKIQFRYVT